jgi:hypothetical protein
MNLLLKIKNEDYQLIGLSASLVIHIIIFFAGIFIINLRFNNQTAVPSYVQISTSEINEKENKEIAASTDENELKRIEEKVAAPELKRELLQLNEDEKLQAEDVYFETNLENADTSNLNLVYKESTLNVSINYPAGWTFIDQNRKNKLDGVTFWSVSGSFNPPPYIHLEVKEKYLFNPDRFAYSYKTRNYTAYYNNPEELSGQVSQTVYIRTNSDEDYSIKLIMNGMESFKNFQPHFYGIVKTFKFGRNLF